MVSVILIYNDLDYALQEKYQMMPFHGCYLSFHGFSDDEKKHMEESTEQQGMS